MLHCFYRKECLETAKKKQMHQFHRALLIRNLMIMLLTDRGHDVAVFDPDAFILQDPMDMYQKIVQEAHAHIIGQQGNMPTNLRKLWGFTLCAGAMYYRSSTPLSKLSRCQLCPCQLCCKVLYVCTFVIVSIHAYNDLSCCAPGVLEFCVMYIIINM